MSFGGRRLTILDCERLVQQTAAYFGPLNPDWLKPTPSKQILARILNNLRLNYMKLEQWEVAIKSIRLLAQLQPQVNQHFRDLGLIHYRLGEFQQASYFLDQYLQKDPEAKDAKLIREAVSKTLTDWSQLN